MCGHCQVTLVYPLKEIHIRLVNINRKCCFPNKTIAYEIIVPLPASFYLVRHEAKKKQTKGHPNNLCETTKLDQKAGRILGPDSGTKNFRDV